MDIAGIYRDRGEHAHDTAFQLDASGEFRFRAVWRGFEEAFASGTWVRYGDFVVLKGRGSMRCCTRRFHDHPFARTLLVLREGERATLVGGAGGERWSLLGSRGPFVRQRHARPVTDPFSQGPHDAEDHH